MSECFIHTFFNCGSLNRMMPNVMSKLSSKPMPNSYIRFSVRFEIAPIFDCQYPTTNNFLPVTAEFSFNILFFLRVKVDLGTPCPWDAKKKKKERKNSLQSQSTDRAEPDAPPTAESQSTNRAEPDAPPTAEASDEEPECDSESPFGDGSSMCSLSLEQQEEPDEDEKCESEQRLDNGHTMCSLATDSELDEPHPFGSSPMPSLNTRCCGERI